MSWFKKKSPKAPKVIDWAKVRTFEDLKAVYMADIAMRSINGPEFAIRPYTKTLDVLDHLLVDE